VPQAQAGLNRAPRAVRALRELRARILSGELGANSHISESAAADMIGISRTPTREALSQLVEEGLLERTASGRCRVRSFTISDVTDAIELRGVLEGTVVRLAAERGADRRALADAQKVLEEIDAALGRSEPEIDFERYTELNAVFHGHLMRMARSQTLEREVARAYRLPLASPNAFLQSQAHLTSVRQSLYVAQGHHRAIIDAVTRREGARAEALAREHARLARQNLNSLMRSDGRLANGIPGLSLVAGAPTSSRKGRTQ
jgi:GntR family transcriptional regulator of vanillate catabolism